MNFSEIDKVADEKFDFVLADLGVSSMQIDNPERGFTFKQDGQPDAQPAADAVKVRCCAMHSI